MKVLRLTRARRVATEQDRQKALAVMQAIYQREKGWVHDVEPMFPKEDLSRVAVSRWACCACFMTRRSSNIKSTA
jgi:hypothetical protein